MMTDRHEQILVDVYGPQYEGCAGWGWAESIEAEETYRDRDLVRPIEDEIGDTADHMDYQDLLLAVSK